MSAAGPIAQCRCCGGAFAFTFDVPSWRNEGWPTFRYGECGVCQSLTLADDFDPVSFHDDPVSRHAPALPAASALRRVVGAVAHRSVMASLPGENALAAAIRRPEWLLWFAGSGLSLRTPILDLGAGSGDRLLELRRWGFSDLTGCDPSLVADSTPAPGVRLLAKPMDAVERTGFGAIIFHHSLEHADDPLERLVVARERLGGAGSRVVVALPVAQGRVWEEYRDNWVALDAPLHRWIPTMRGLRLLSARAGFDVGRATGTCTESHLVSSELVARRIPLSVDPRSVLSAGELRDLHGRTRSLRHPDNAPQVSIVLTPRAES